VERNGNSKLTPFTMYMLALEVILSRFKQSIVCGVILYTVSKISNSLLIISLASLLYCVVR